MVILEETAARIKQNMGEDYARITIERIVIGPTASFLPESLFQRGVRVVGGVWVKKPDDLLDILAAGGSGYHFFDKIAPRIVIEQKRREE